MTLTAVQSWIARALIGLFLVFQLVSVSHAAQYGDAPHDHDTVVCVLGVTSADQQAVIPAPVVTPTPPAIFTPPAYVAPKQSLLISVHTARAPPPRGPPASFI